MSNLQTCRANDLSKPEARGRSTADSRFGGVRGGRSHFDTERSNAAFSVKQFSSADGE